MLEEDPVSAPDGGLAIAPRIPGKPDAGSGIEQVALHAAHRNASRHSALHHSVRKVAD